MKTAVMLIAATLVAVPAAAQDGDKPPLRTRVGLGAQLVPSFPGSDRISVRPFAELSRTRGDVPFAFEAPDESADFALFQDERFAIGPAINFEGKRRRSQVGGVLSEVGFTVEAGGFVQYAFTPAFRIRAEGRKGLGGHRGWIGQVGADYVARDGDKWLFSLGPRVTLSDRRYQRAYFDISPADALASGLPVYRSRGALQAVGAVAGYSRQFTPRWGVLSYARYDRLVGDAADSPVVDRFGSRNQLSGGLALTYTFGRDVD